MPSVAVIVPVLLPLVAAAVIALIGLGGMDLGRAAAAIGSWGSVLALIVVWAPIRSSLELALGPLGFGSSFDMRIDGVTFAFGLMNLFGRGHVVVELTDHDNCVKCQWAGPVGVGRIERQQRIGGLDERWRFQRVTRQRRRGGIR